MGHNCGEQICEGATWRAPTFGAQISAEPISDERTSVARISAERICVGRVSMVPTWAGDAFARLDALGGQRRTTRLHA
jgi:hypothetical protein